MASPWDTSGKKPLQADANAVHTQSDLKVRFREGVTAAYFFSTWATSASDSLDRRAFNSPFAGASQILCKLVSRQGWIDPCFPLN